jgi:trimeric autotransporter adhesin
MKNLRYSVAAFVLVLSLSGWLLGQQATTPSAAVVPQLVNFSGKAMDGNGSVVTGIAGVTFSIYKDQYEGAPLWMETQNVTADAKGNYTVQLGVTKSDGLPLELFSTGEARWLGVRINGGEEQPRVLLLSVPYALKAADAQTLGGLPASAFMLAAPNNASSSTVSHTSAKVKSAVSASVSGSGKTDYIPLWTNTTGGLGDSVLYQAGTKVGVNTTTPATALDVKGKVNASGGFDLAGKTFAFGSYANGNAFLGFSGNTSNTGGSNTASGVYALVSDTTGSANAASGYDALYGNTTGNFNTASGSYALQSNTSGSANSSFGSSALGANTTGSNNTAVGANALNDNRADSNTAVGASALYANTTGYYNTATGYQALYANTTGFSNTAVGQSALYSNTTGTANTANGLFALYSDTTGYDNTAAGVSALYSNTTGYYNTAVGIYALNLNSTGNELTCVGYECEVTADGLTNATAIGAHAVVGQSNSLVLGGTGAHAVKVGIGTTTPSNVLTIGRGLGHPVSDSWETYSSRRWKTNIQTLPDALSKVGRLRGVSYDLKDSGKHEIGVIAEEVGQVLPEVVSYEANGKDASGVDYSRLTALLIEAVKQQQKQIAMQQSQIRQQQRLMAAQQNEVARLNRKVSLLEASRRDDEAKQPTAVALK